MAGSLNTYIQRARKRLGLSQREVALLLGKRSGSYVSRFEKGRRIPTLDVAFALSVVLGTSLEELFAGRLEKVEQSVKERAAKLPGESYQGVLARLLSALEE